MYKSYLERGYYPLNTTPIEKIIYDYKYEIEALKWHKEQLNKYRNQEMKELECLESDIEILKNTKWNESEYKKVKDTLQNNEYTEDDLEDILKNESKV